MNTITTIDFATEDAEEQKRMAEDMAAIRKYLGKRPNVAESAGSKTKPMRRTDDERSDGRVRRWRKRMKMLE